MKNFFRALAVIILIYGTSYIVFRSVHIETYAKDKKSYVIYSSEDYVYKLFRPMAYVDERLTGTGSHIGPHDAGRTVFTETGVLVRDNPGLKPATWYLSYQSPGRAEEILELSFTGGASGAGLFVGDRVSVVGTRQNDKVVVSKISKEKLY